MKKILLIFAAMMLWLGATAQNSAPAPGSGSITPPAFGGGFGPAAPLPPPAPAWGSPWGYGWNGYYGYGYSPTVIVSPSYQESGKTNVIGVGYDDEGVWRTVPMSVEYNADGSQYDVEVLTAWNPWTDTWNLNLNIPAQNTSYLLDGTTYDYYVVLSTGTYYFNL